MFTAKLVDVQPDPQFPKISVSTIQFYKDNASFGLPDIERGLTKDQLITYCKQKVLKLEQDTTQESGMADLISSPPLGDISVFELPTAAENAEKDLNESLDNLLFLKRKVELGVIDENHPDYVSALDDAIAKQTILDEL